MLNGTSSRPIKVSEPAAAPVALKTPSPSIVKLSPTFMPPSIEGVATGKV